MKAILGILAWIVRDFGPLIAFYATNHFFGFVPAIIATIVWSVGDVVIVKLKKQKMTAFLKFSIIVSLGFGAVDFYLRGPFLFRYEAVLSNIVTGVFFGLTLRGEKTIIQEFAERRAAAKGEPASVNVDTLYYFRLCSIVWTAYFFLKAIVYAWLAYAFDLEKALAIRLVIGNISFYILLGVSIFLARPIIRFLRHIRWAPSTRAQPSAA